VFQESINVEINQMFVEEMLHFIRCVQEDEKPVLDIREASAVLNIVLAARQSASEGRIVRVNS